ncbi:MAG: 2TM domain-containing protein [Winogradskyella sp.]|uniref:2TM domain-containing protein n=1 Tax=Winogradskyella sp. TaxID=1883156 RepID=UPI0025F29386|nr:2TM domain-containing protein [Winogradskyella sp.]NRB58576.1 2TM domain-containing protein [Winogradskyella sp.]
MNNQESNLSYIRAKNKVEKEKSFYIHLIIFIIVNVVITAFKVWSSLDSWDSFTNELISINVLATWVIWGIFLVLHYVSFKYGQGWEERKIEQFMNQELSDDSKKY